MLIKRPIYNQQLKCVAFEVLSYQKLALNKELTQKLFELINNSDNQLPLFIPFSLKHILEECNPPINNPIILKLPAEEIESVYSLTELKDSLFSIALLINKPQELTWLNFAEYVCLTEELLNVADVRKVVQFSKSNQRKVIAYGIAKPLNFDKCKEISMDYYCGDFLFQPMDDGETEIAGNKLNLLQLIQTLHQENCHFDEITKIIQSDPLLSFQLLKVANSAGFGSYQEIESIDQAINRLGLINLKNWVMVLSMKNISDKPLEILESGLIRAHMAKELAQVSPNMNSQSAYTAGLLSILDCLLNKPIADLLHQIKLTEDVKTALIKRSGQLGEMLALVIAYEEGHWELVTQQTYEGIDLSKLYIDTLSAISNTALAMHE